MSERKPLFMDDYGYPEEIKTSDSITLGGLTIGSTGNITLSGGGEVVGLPDVPTGDSSSTSKKYVDSVASGLDPKQEVRVATTGDLTSYVAAGSGVGATLEAPDDATSHNTIDGVLLEVDDRVLVKDFGGGISHVDNGIYVVTTLGDGAGAKFKLTRATDFDEDTEVTAGATTFVVSGTTNSKHHYVLVTPNPITVDTTAQQYGLYGGPGQSHDSLTDVSADDHHNELHSVASHNDTSATGAELDTLTDGSDAAGLHVHADSDLTVAHASTTGQTADDHHSELHSIASHNDTSATGAELDTLTDGSDAAGLHVHADGDLTVAHASTTGQTADDHHNELHSIASHNDTSATGAELDELVGAGLTVLHAHTGVTKAERNEYAFNADADVALGDPVYPTSDDGVTPCNNTVGECRQVMGIALEAKATGNDVAVGLSGLLKSVVTGRTAGQLLYINTPNGMTHARPAASGSIVYIMGKAVSSTDMVMFPQYVGKVA